MSAVPITSSQVEQAWKQEKQARLLAEERIAQLQTKLGRLEAEEQQLQDAQRQLLHTEKMASLGQLAAGVAHEINNPVGFVLSNLDTLKGYLNTVLEILEAYRQAGLALPEKHPLRCQAERQERDGELDFLLEDLPALLGESQTGLERIRAIIVDLRNFSRNDDGEHGFMSINDCIEEAVRIARPRWKHHVEIETDLQPIPLVFGVAGRILQVFVNLIVNAAQAIEGEGWIRISTRQVGDVIEARVSDSGMGIPADGREAIFSPFFTTKPAGEGTGLGLAVSAGIIARHAGSVEVEDGCSPGATFLVRIPVDHRVTQLPPAVTA